jgi:TolB-like protein/Tfp pilus assembly protein PilF
MPDPTLLERLKARKVAQWGLAYLGGVWVLLEATSLVADQFHWPAMVVRVELILALLGFFVVLVVAWYHGDKGRQRVSGPELVIIALLLVVTGGMLSMLGNGEAGRETDATSPGRTDDGRPAIAVLPCENFSPNPEDAFFAAGIHEEILLKLQRISGLRSIGRETVEWYRNNPRPMREMALELGVGFVGECSVRMDFDQRQIRLTFQVIDGENGSQLWAENYDSQLTTGRLFDIQSDIAQQVASSVGAVLTPEEQRRIEVRPTENLDAFGAYSMGRVWMERRGAQGSQALLTAIDFFEQALEDDSLFAPALAGLAGAYSLSPSYGEFVSNEIAYERARTAAGAALRIDEDLAEAHAARGFMKSQFEWDWDEARAEQERALELNPSYPTAHHWLGFAFICAGNHQEGLASIRRAFELDPLSPIISEDFGDAMYYARQYGPAVDQYNRTLSLYPDRASTLVMLGLAYLQLGRYQEARDEFLAAVEGEEGAWSWGAEALARAYHELGEDAAAQRVIERSIGFTPRNRLYAVAGVFDTEEAFAIISEALAVRAPWLWRVRADPYFDFLRNDPRYHQLLAELGHMR